MRNCFFITSDLIIQYFALINLNLNLQLGANANFSLLLILLAIHLLGRDVKCLGPHVNYLECVHTRNNKEDARTPSSPSQEAAHAEDDSSLKLLDHLEQEARISGDQVHQSSP